MPDGKTTPALQILDDFDHKLRKCSFVPENVNDFDASGDSWRWITITLLLIGNQIPNYNLTNHITDNSPMSWSDIRWGGADFSVSPGS